MATSKQITNAMRKKFGKAAFTRFNRSAPSEDQKKLLRVAVGQRQVRRDQIKHELTRHAKDIEGLADAAQFVVDVDGDHPSIEQLSAALGRYKRGRELLDELQDLKRQAESNDGLHRYRHEVLVQKNIAGLPFVEHVCGADTLDELLIKLRADSAEASHTHTTA